MEKKMSGVPETITDPIKSLENLADEYTNAVNFGASMTLIFVGPSRSDTSHL